MNLVDVFSTVRTALNNLTGLPAEFSLRPKHPDNVDAFPFASLEPGQEAFAESGAGDIYWQQPLDSSAILVARVYVSDNPLATEILEKSATVNDAIKSAVQTFVTAGFRARVRSIDYEFERSAKWAAATITIEIGAYA